ncbi:ParB/RepB/Spo0J family partition protein [Hyphococcus luteus]|nr:ParB/RepB/Spo0J family partition protein [Marinicaulis flavus]
MSEHQAALKTGERIELPLSKLILSKDNPRKTACREADPELIASIRSVGLLQNLGVRAAPENPGKFEVRFGGRRLRALRALSKQGYFGKDAQFPCTIVSDDEKQAQEAALAENVARQSMNPVDEFEAFSRLEESGLEIPDIAGRFAITERQVRQRLALGRAAPCVRNALRAGEIALDIAMAFAGASDISRQERVFKAMKERGGFSEFAVRRMLHEGAISADDDLARFVGVEAYEKAGGRTETDLFSNENRLIDPEIVYRLRDDRLAAGAERLAREGWSWVETHESHSWQALAAFDRIYGEPVEPSEEEANEIERISADIAAYEARAEDEMSDEDWDAVDALEENLAKLQSGRRRFSSEQKAVSGCIIYPERNGLGVHEGLVRKADRKKAARLNEPEGEGDGKADPANAGYGKALRADLASFRAQALRAGLAGAPRLAQTALQFAIVFEALGPCAAARPEGLTFSAPAAQLRVAKGELGETPAAARLLAIEKELRLDIFSSGSWRGAWEAFKALRGDERAALAAFSLARMIEPINDEEGFASVLGVELGLSIREYWTPTADNFFSRIRKDDLAEFLTQTVGKERAAFLTREFKAKKSEIAAVCERLTDGTTPLKSAERDAVGAWAPRGMAFAIPAGLSAKNDAPGEDIASGEERPATQAG